MATRRSLLVLGLIAVTAGRSSAETRDLPADDFDRIKGGWFINTMDASAITALSLEAAHSFLGQRAEFDENFMSFGPVRCDIARYVLRPGLTMSDNPDDNIPETIAMICQKQGPPLLPVLHFERDARAGRPALLATLGGVDFGLGREPLRTNGGR